jgi:hypothetical protein
VRQRRLIDVLGSKFYSQKSRFLLNYFTLWISDEGLRNKFKAAKSQNFQKLCVPIAILFAISSILYAIRSY